ncbi:hypothetical protein [Rossellomorea sp. BNER]|uniref:hypothetical protein n=1 Tax=Rossellomorea sp. BNER TaxID=2962031 RepID=UPI003AF23252|nr:hypothetical protein [Rossellomorea sp. BNER]
MTEIERAEEYANTYIKNYQNQMNKLGFAFPIVNYDAIEEDEDFMEMLIQHIRLKGYRVMRVDDPDGLALKLSRD